ncbi:MAG: Ethanolamine utilization polyhedral-body-like protein EutN [Candidatus Ozemobacter sibiricus]|jgi:ethanolamine utilization protein EutN|uniref:Ethanolamine utilization polyhedral-body-like protein EutN n=1 Tax=Candidatus Ozemobacter sibiricus TaxID=2268124 RepID=A0A367ZTX3_9BACT|nr:MAG: Ethanolamine utilization polyhedral-body-like protein EutN [Candidatus Ozemobacter sibiricus]
MNLGRVCGTVVCTRKDERLEGIKLLVVEELTIDAKPTGKYVIAADAVGAGAAETVLLVSGSSARLTDRTLNKPVDAAIAGIVDAVVMDQERGRP